MICHFKLVNSCIGLFAIVFYDEDIGDVAESVGSIYIAKKFLNYAMQVIVPYVLDWWKIHQLNKKLEKSGANQTEDKVKSDLGNI